MADVPLTLAVISTVSPVVAGAVPLIIGWIRDAGRDKRDRDERLTAERVRLVREKRGECVKLLRLARDFRVVVENTHDSRGSDLDTHAQQIRQLAADITGQADEVGFMVVAAESTANSLADEARVLATAISDIENRALGASLRSPDFTTFDQCLAEFKAAALAALDEQPGLSAGRPGETRGEKLPRPHTAAGIGTLSERVGIGLGES